MKKTVLSAIGLLLSSAVFAADPAAESGEPIQDSLAPPNCSKPEVPSPASADSDASRLKKKGDNLQQQFDAYRACMKKYVDGQGELSRRHIAAANAAVGELNALVNQLNEAQGR
jgi:hypothetical protein